MAGARPGSFTGATDNASEGGLFGDALIDGIPDIVGEDVAAAQTAATNAATSEANAATSETNAATSATNAASDASDAAASAASAAGSAATATTKATAAATSATNAATSAASAASSLTNIGTSEANAAASATSAASSATSATSSANSALSSASTATTKASEASTSATNAATSETNAATSETNAATSATNAATSATNAATSATNASTSETNASASETAAAASETAAAASETAAATSETNAATSETNAATSATNAATSATAAASSATAAAASEAAAAGYTDSFDDKYLGAKSTEPTVDNDGDALTDGALYFNTTDDRMKVYDLVTTSWLFIAPSSSDQTNTNTVATNITNVNTVATNIVDVNTFAEQYSVGATAPSSPTEGDLWFDTANNDMKVYDGSNFVLAGSAINGTTNRESYVATAGQTSFNVTYDVGFVDVYLNGVKLVDGSDFTATNGTSITLSSGATLNDTVDIVAYGTFTLGNTELNDLTDVNTSGLSNGDVLVYNSTSGNFEPGTAGASAGFAIAMSIAL
jgi:hypothetical protein